MRIFAPPATMTIQQLLLCVLLLAASQQHPFSTFPAAAALGNAESTPKSIAGTDAQQRMQATRMQAAALAGLADSFRGTVGDMAQTASMINPQVTNRRVGEWICRAAYGRGAEVQVDVTVIRGMPDTQVGRLLSS